MNNTEQSSVELLKKSLYSRAKNAIRIQRRKRLEPHEDHTAREWEHDTDVAELFARASGSRLRKPPSASLFLGGSFIFFLLAAGVAVLLFYGGRNVLSPGNIDISIAGPVTIDAGEELELFVTVTNNNTAALDATDLIAEFPDGTRHPDNLKQEFLRFRESMGTIAPGETVQKIIHAVLFGEEGKTIDVPITFEYRLAGSNAIFSKEGTYTATISASPVRVSIESVKEINSGQEAVFTLEVVSNSPGVLENIILTAEYPFGFVFAEAAPTPSIGSAVWRLGDLEPGAKRKITIRGTIEGQNQEDRLFRFSVGIEDSRDPKRISTLFLTQLHNITIKKPFLAVELALDGDVVPVFAVSPGRDVRVDITWKNNLPVKVVDGEIELKINGIPLDKTSVVATKGFYRSVDNVVFWNKQTDQQLLELEPGSSGQVSMSFSTFRPDSSVLSALRNPEMSLDVSVKGRRVSETGVPETIVSTAQAGVVVISNLALSSRTTYFSGPFVNSGPIPPKAERETTYTATWSITNTTNNIDDVRVVAPLPPYVRWMGVTAPSGEDVTFNPVGGTVTWNVGDVPAATGFSNSPRSVSFQVAFVPSVSQIGTAPTIIERATAVGFDSFAKTEVRYTAQEATTLLGTDPQYRSGQDRVVE